jgi:hypothetical protein
MKIILISLLILITARVVSAQKALLPFDEHNKYIYYQVVDQPMLAADTMYSRALYFLNAAYPKLKVKTDKTNESISGSGKFVVTSTMLLKHEDGEISFTYNIESKEHKYRYWLTGFTFTPFKTDRYGQSVPVAGVEIPLETGIAKLTQKQVDSYLDQSGAYSKQFGDRLKQYMLRLSVTPVNETKTKVISTKSW